MLVLEKILWGLLQYNLSNLRKRKDSYQVVRKCSIFINRLNKVRKTLSDNLQLKTSKITIDLFTINLFILII